MQKLILPFLCFAFFACNDGAELQSKLQEMETKLAETEAKLAEAGATAEAPGMIHSVFFWLNEDISKADEKAFLGGLESLREVGSARTIHIGPPAPTEERGVVDNSFSYALIVHFDDVAGQDAYQVDPIHTKFVEDHKDKWTKVVVYDNLVRD